MVAGSRGITPYMRTRDNALRKNNPGYGPERFTYLPENNSYRCPAGEQLNYVGLNVRNRAHAYIGSAKRCAACCQKAQCTSGRYKYLAIHVHESARQRARELAQHTRVFSSTTSAKESRGFVRGTKESYRAAPLAFTTHEVRSGTVLPGSSGAKHQATGAIPQRIDNTCSGNHQLNRGKKEKLAATSPQTKGLSITDFFNTTDVTTVTRYLTSITSNNGVLMRAERLKQECAAHVW